MPRMTGPRVLWRVALAVVFATLCVRGDDVEGASRPPRRAADMPRAAYSADGFVEIMAVDVPGDGVGFRLPLLRFATQLIGELEHGYGLEMPRTGAAGLVIHALDGQTNDVRVIASVVRRDGRALTRIYLPSPGYSSIDLLQLEIVKAYLRGWIDRNRPAGDVMPSEPPEWFAFGILRARTADGAHDDMRAVLNAWADGRPTISPASCVGLRIATMRDAVHAGYLVAWLKEKKGVRTMLDGLAAGRRWSDERFVIDLTGETDADAQRRAFQTRLDRLSRAVLSPGRASAWDVRNFRRQLRLDVQPVEGEADGVAAQSCTFRRAIKLLSERPLAVRSAAIAKMRELPMYAVRRGPEMASVSEAYSEFLVMLSRGAAADRLDELLDKAEYQLSRLVDGRNANGQSGNTTLSAPSEDKFIR